MLGDEGVDNGEGRGGTRELKIGEEGVERGAGRE